MWDIIHEVFNFKSQAVSLNKSVILPHLFLFLSSCFPYLNSCFYRNPSDCSINWIFQATWENHIPCERAVFVKDEWLFFYLNIHPSTHGCSVGGHYYCISSLFSYFICFQEQRTLCFSPFMCSSALMKCVQD